MSLVGAGRDPSSIFSQETLLHIFKHLSACDLTSLERVSRKWQRVSRSGYVWRMQYAKAFSLPRLKRTYELSRRKKCSWRNLFKEHSNWSRGRCIERVQSLYGDHNEKPYFVTRIWGDFVYHATVSGFKTFALVDGQLRLKTGYNWSSLFLGYRLPSPCLPSCMAKCRNLILMAFEDSSFVLFRLRSNERLSVCHIQKLPNGSILKQVSFAEDYIVGYTNKKELMFWYVRPTKKKEEMSDSQVLRFLGQLFISYAEPVAIRLSVRHIGTHVFAIVVHSEYVYSCGWCLGVQHFLLTPTRFNPSTFVPRDLNDRVYTKTPPTSISISIPYILASFADNSMVLLDIGYVERSAHLYMKNETRLMGQYCNVKFAKILDSERIVSASYSCADVCLWDLCSSELSSLQPVHIRTSPLPSVSHSTAVVDLGLIQSFAVLALDDGRFLIYDFS